MADGYVLSQREILRDDMDLEVFGGDQFETFQLPITQIETLTDLDFGDLRDGDTFGESFDEHLDEELEQVGGEGQARKIRSLEDIRLDV